MKAKIKAALLSIGLLAGSISMANAADGTVTFLGSVHSGACSIKPDSVDQTIHLGAIAKHQLQSGGKSEARRVLIELEGCSLSDLTDNTVTTTFIDDIHQPLCFCTGRCARRRDRHAGGGSR